MDDGLTEHIDVQTMYISNKLPSPQQLQEQQNKNIAHGVFVLYRGDNQNAKLIGTAFAVPHKLVLTACHNVVVPAAQEGGEAVKKSDDGTFQPGTPVSVYKYNTPVNWAYLKCNDKDNVFPFIIPVGTQASDVPQPATHEKLFIYLCPVQLFIHDDEIDACHVIVKEASIGCKTIKYKNGAFPGSCGGSYIFHNKALVLHADSVSTTKTANALKNEKATISTGRKRKLTTAEAALMIANSCASSYTSLGMGILLHIRHEIMDLLQQE
eukprot:scaffold7213_cov166-Amphora_coffeaeformis.AAC.10